MRIKLNEDQVLLRDTVRGFANEVVRPRAKEIDESGVFPREFFDEAGELGVRDIAFVGGGEPLARDITYKLMKRIRAHGMEGDLVTNGSLLTDEMIHTLVDVGWTRVKFSVVATARK